MYLYSLNQNVWNMNPSFLIIHIRIVVKTVGWLRAEVPELGCVSVNPGTAAY